MRVDSKLQVSEASRVQPNLTPIRRWVIEHDNSWLFTLSYVGLAVGLSLLISLFWLVVVVAVHGLFEWIRQRHLDSRVTGVAARMIWELKLDIGLVLFALALAVYMEFVFGLAGLGTAGKLAQTSARGAGWIKAIRGLLLSLDDAAQLGKAVVARRERGATDQGEARLASMWGGWTGKWSAGSHLAIWFGVICLLAIPAAPWVTGLDWEAIFRLLARDLHPWPGFGF